MPHRTPTVRAPPLALSVVCRLPGGDLETESLTKE
jgi:hypothetical protein